MGLCLRFNIKYSFAWISVTCLSLLSPAVYGASEARLDNLAEELIQLRGEVEELHSQLEVKKEQHRNRMASLARQEGELQSSINRQQRSIAELEQSLQENRERAREAGIAADELKPVVSEAIDQAHGMVDGSLPFKPAERRQALDDIHSQLNSGVLTPHKAVNRLWSFYEDELGLTNENGIYRQSIELDGKEQLAEVARIGTVMMYFRTSDGVYGETFPTDQGWAYRVLSDADKVKQVKGVFAALQKQIRAGFFQLPNPYRHTGGQ